MKCLVQWWKHKKDMIKVNYFYYLRALFLLDWAFKDKVLYARYDAKIQWYNNEWEETESLQSLLFIGRAVDLCSPASRYQNQLKGLLQCRFLCLGLSWEHAFLTSSQVVLTMLAWEPYFAERLCHGDNESISPCPQPLGTCICKLTFHLC